jgi:hypothetical protein
MVFVGGILVAVAAGRVAVAGTAVAVGAAGALVAVGVGSSSLLHAARRRVVATRETAGKKNLRIEAPCRVSLWYTKLPDGRIRA